LAPFFRRGKLKLRFFHMVDEKPFEVADGDRAIFIDSFTLPLARMGTDIGKDSRKRKFLPHKGEGFFELPLGDEGHIALSVAV
jgi:hypothetical protein